MKKILCPLFFICIGLGTAHAALDKRYPTDPVTQLRWDTYIDSFVQIASETAAGPFPVARKFAPPDVPPNLPMPINWQYVTGSTDSITWFLPDPMQMVTGTMAVLFPGATGYTLIPTSCTFTTAQHLIYSNTKAEDINIIADQMEEYMIWSGTDVAHMYVQGSTTTINSAMWPPVGGWLGWCYQIINGKQVPVACPPQ